MNYKYRNLSPGYVGELCENLTHNSKYYSALFSAINESPDVLNNIIAFPQRIPRKGFFEELCNIETYHYRERFDSTVSQLANAHLQSLKNICQYNSVENARHYINWCNILIRYGKFENVVNYFPENYSGPYSLEIELIKETAKIEIILSQDKFISIDELLELSDRFIDDTNTNDHEKIKLLNQIIVYFYRYQRSSFRDTKTFYLSKLLLSHIKKYESNIFLNDYLCSVAYRGLAMVHHFDTDMRKSFLNKSIELAIHIKPQTKMEKIVSLDNLFTCKQSLAKWYAQINNPQESESSLLELTMIDPHDSTGFNELGFFHLRLESYDKAAQHFKKAMELGPPGTGMNAYYYAKCLERLGKEEDAIKYLHQASEFDKEAVSPWLDLLNIYETNKDKDKICQIANYIYNNTTLMEQLEENEIIFIKNIIS